MRPRMVGTRPVRIQHDCGRPPRGRRVVMETESTTSGSETGNGHRSIGELTKAISRDSTALVRAEVQLAKDEMAAKAKESAVGGGMLAVAALFGVAAFGTF